VLELGGIGAAPFAAMLLADQGAEVIKLENPSAATTPAPRPTGAAASRPITCTTTAASARSRSI